MNHHFKEEEKIAESESVVLTTENIYNWTGFRGLWRTFSKKYETDCENSKNNYEC